MINYMSVDKYKVRYECLAFLSLFLIILNPYTKFGPLGSYVSLFVLFFGFPFLGAKYPFIRSFFILSVLALYGSFVSSVNNIAQLNHLTVVISFIVVFYVGFIISKLAIRNGVGKEKFLSLVNNVIFLNCCVILFQLTFPHFRVFVESVLIEAGNRDWSEGFRYRGLASSGGAALSLLSSISVLITMHLFKKKYYNGVRFLVYISVVLFSTMIIGRTGLVISGLAFFFYSLYFFADIKLSTLISITIISMSVLFSLLILFPYIEEIMIDQYGEGFLYYSFGFLLEGKSGLEGEGTLKVLIDFLSVFPVDFPYVLTGYGFFGGSDFSPWTDSGLARTFLSLGVPLGILFYSVVFCVFYKCLNGDKDRFLFLLMAACLFIGELKESMMYSGYSARAFVLVISFIYFYNKTMKESGNGTI